MRMKRYIPFPLLAVVATFFLLPLAGCGGEEKPIPKEERGEPNILPEEIVLYREAREVFRDWVRLFDDDRSYSEPFRRLSRASRSSLRAQGVNNAEDFANWFRSRLDAGLTPFAYTFTRFDVLDIEMRDSSSALLTATFLVRFHDATFESVGTFRLRREGGAWVVPFTESGDFEGSWWQKERQFTSRIREEGSSTFSSDNLGLSFRYPIGWDVGRETPQAIPGQSATLPGVELSYVDPSSLQTQVLVRVAVFTTTLPDSIAAQTSDPANTSVRVLRREEATVAAGAAMHGRTFWLADAANSRYILVTAAVGAGAEYRMFSQTIEALVSSIISTKRPTS